MMDLTVYEKEALCLALWMAIRYEESYLDRVSRVQGGYATKQTPLDNISKRGERNIKLFRQILKKLKT